jgi:hypothetical protein
MTESEWLACYDVRTLLKYLENKSSDRKMRFFTCACCRRVWHLINDERSRHTVEIVEQFADGKATEEDLNAAHQAALAGYRSAGSQITGESQASEAVWEAASERAWSRRREAQNVAWWVAHRSAAAAAKTVLWHTERTAQAALIHDIFGNPFRPVAVDPAWLRWNDGTVGKLAQAVYDDRRFADLPILADALEDAGCTDPAVLAHCRAGGEHVRGCWVVDLLLGKT